MDSADCLRQACEVAMPDPRMRSMSLEARHDAVKAIELRSSVSDDVRIHFETAKNLYLYAWHVYRFHMVAEQYVLSTLELAARERLLRLGKLRGNKAPGLAGLLRIARENKLVTNERLVARQRWALSLARKRFQTDQLVMAVDAKLEEFVIDDRNVKPSLEELEFDWLSHFSEHLPNFRNMHAHGTQLLTPSTVLWTIEIVAELINQLYEGDVAGT